MLVISHILINYLKNEFPPEIQLINGYELFKKYPLDEIYTLRLNEQEQKTLGLEIDPVHPNALGYAYVAKIFLEEGYGIVVDPERYIEDIRSDKVKYPML